MHPVTMLEQYGHTLVAEAPDFVPRPGQVVQFFAALVNVGAQPMKAKLQIVKPTGKLRSFSSPFTGKTESRPILEHVPIENIGDIAEGLQGVHHYDVEMSGLGPPSLPPLQLEFCGEQQSGDHKTGDGATDDLGTQSTWNGNYSFDVACSLRSEPVSTSSKYTGNTNEPPSFGQPCMSSNRVGFFEHPHTGAMIEVANAGCARFWIEFRFGKWLFPKIKDSLDLLEPAIVKVAEQSFATKFAQGCHVYV
jgi:hypothetical protein